MTGNRQIFDDLASRQALTCQVELVVHLRVIDFKVFRETDLRCVDELHVSRARNHELDGYGIVGLQLLRTDGRTQSELTHSAREVRRLACRKFLHVDGQLGSDDVLLDVPHVSAIEESVERVSRSHHLRHVSFKGDRRDFEFSRLLREKHELLPNGCVIVPSVIMLQRESLLLRKRNFLCVETFQVGHIAMKLGQVHLGINLVSQQNGFLFIHVCLACRCGDEQFLIGNLSVISLTS